jgi:hypothetical protein
VWFLKVGNNVVKPDTYHIKHAQDTYEANLGDKPDGDITEIEPSNIPNCRKLSAGTFCFVMYFL